MTKSLWQEIQLPSFNSLKKDFNTDICIVGGGIAGLTCAYRLLRAGKKVALLEKGALGEGETSRTTAHLTWVLDDRYFDLEKIYGEEGAKLAANSHAAAIDEIEEIVKREEIACNFERVEGYLFLAPEDKEDVLLKEFKAINKFNDAVIRHAYTPLGEKFKNVPCLQIPNQGEFHVHKYLRGLIEAILKMGGHIFTHTKVVEVVDQLVTTEKGHKVFCDHAIVATCTPINDRFYIHTKQAAYRTYVVAGKISAESAPKGIFWDTPDPYHYVRTLPVDSDPSEKWLVVGGEDHKVGQNDDCNHSFERLEKWVKQHFPNLMNISYRWSGQIYEPVDSLAFIGKNPGDHAVYICTGDSGNGITHGTVAALVLTDLILEGKSPWKELYCPSRKTISTLKTYLEENLNGAMQYLDWLTPGEKGQVEALAPGEGMLIREGLHKIAVHKDVQGKLHFLSPFCPHLGGCVQWNNAEKSWDCPVHGSRFDATGKTLIGPAKSNLSSCQNCSRCQAEQ